MYTKKPKINENNEMVFKKSGLLLFCGILYAAIFSLCAIFMDDYVSDIIREHNLDTNMTDTLFTYGYSLTALFVLMGIILIVKFFKHKIIVSKDAITSKKLFSTKTIRLSEIETVTFSNSKGIVIKSSESKIAFGYFTTGLVEILKFIDENIPKHKSETALIKAKKMLRSNMVNVA